MRRHSSGSGTLGCMLKPFRIGLFGAGLLLLGLALYRVPPVKSRVDWRLFRVTTYLNGILHPLGAVPTALPTATDDGPRPAATPSPRPSPTVMAEAPTPTPTRPPLPARVLLPAPLFEDEKKFPNNCGPATLTMALRMYGWNGDQFDISEIIKPRPDDRNVNPDELKWWVEHNAGWLRAEYRVNGDLTRLKELLAAGFAVIIEKTFTFDSPYWPGDDLWAAHYVLVTGYDEGSRTFIVQDAYHGPNLNLSYERLEQEWEPFNHLYLLVFLHEEEASLRALLGSDWDPDTNRQNALRDTQAATRARPDDAFAWFNYGSNLVYFERYSEAVAAYSEARKIGLPQRMMRYQFGPFIADFHADQLDDLLAITQDTLDKAGYKWSEEAWLWKGYALFRKGDPAGARKAWETALSVHPRYCDAEYAINTYIQPLYPLESCIP